MALPPLPVAPAGTVTRPGSETPPSAWRALLGMGSCWWAASLVAGAVAFVAIGVPTAIVPTPYFGRSVAPHWWDVALLVVSSILVGMVWASRTPRSPENGSAETDGLDGLDGLDDGERAGRRRSVVGAALTYVAVGCPTCNKLVLAALGTSGALSWFAPVQPVLGLAAVTLLAVTLRRRLRSVGSLSCAT